MYILLMHQDQSLDQNCVSDFSQAHLGRTSIAITDATGSCSPHPRLKCLFCRGVHFSNCAISQSHYIASSHSGLYRVPGFEGPEQKLTMLRLNMLLLVPP